MNEELRKLAYTDPIVHQALYEHSAGRMSLEEALTAAVIALSKAHKDTHDAFVEHLKHCPPTRIDHVDTMNFS